MLLKKPTIEIDPLDPFKEDVLKRSESAEILTQLLQSIDEPFVLAIDSGWGTGKTTFIQMWKKHLQNNEFSCLYFNAWENDFSDDPLISFIGEMQSFVDKLDDDGKKTMATKCLKEVKKNSYLLFKRFMPIAVKLASQGAIELSDLTKIVDGEIDSHQNNKKILNEFRKNLEELVKEITGSQDEDKENKPLVFFIDELDRCKPTYAIELLERLKHLFSVTGIVFVLALDKDEIAHSINSLYGKIDADGYLRRFIDLDYKLPDVPQDRYCRYLFQKFGFSEHFKDMRGLCSDDGIDLLNTFIGLSQVFNFSLRVQEQCFTQFSIALRTTEYGIKIYPTFLAALISLKAANKPLYQDYVNGKKNYKEVLEYLGKWKGGTEFVNGNYGVSMHAHMFYNHYPVTKCTDECNQNDKNANNTNLNSEDRNKAMVMARELKLLLNEELLPGDLLRHLVKRIEISEQFVD